MIQLEEYPCENKRQAERREEEVRLERNAQLNMKKAFINISRITYSKIYCEENKEKKREWDKEYRKANNEKIKEKRKKSREDNKEKINEQKRQRYHKKKAEKLLNNIHNEPSTSDQTA
jgi:post-segregation antitoxin (ccd killing protein)